MKKNLKILFWVIVIIVSYYFVYQNWGQKYGNITDIEESAITIEEDIVPLSFKTKVLNPNDLYVTFDVKYPYFIKADDSFNATIENLIKTKMNEHIKASKDYWQARLDTQIKGENLPKIPNKEDKLSFFSDFTIVQSNSNYISFVLKYGGFSGGAHGYETEVSFNYDMYTQKIITLDYLFPNDPQYLTTISNISRESLKKQFATVTEEDKKNSSRDAIKEYVDNMVSMINQGTEPKEENFAVFTFTRDKVKIYFADYQVGPHAIGMPEIEINRR